MPPGNERSVFFRGLSVIGSYIAMHPVPFTIAVLGAATYAASTVASAVVLGRVTDTVILPAFEEGVSTGAIAGGAAAILAVAIIRAGAIIVRRYFAGMTAARVRASLQRQVIDRYRELPLAYHRSRPAGELLAHADADTEAATNVLHPLPFSAAAVLLIVFALVSLILTDWFLAGIGLLILPIITILNRMFGRKIEPPATRAQQRVGEVSSVAHESFDGALIVKTLALEEREIARLEDRAEKLRLERVEFGRLRAGFEPSFEALPNLGIVVLLAVGSWRVSTGAVTIGVLVQFISLFQLLAFPMRLIGWVLSDIPRAVVGRDRLESVFSEKSNLPTVQDPRPLPAGPLDVAVRNLSFGYDGYRVLDEIDFDVSAHESVAIVGATGAGKSTLAQLLVRLADPDRGSIHMGGVDLRHVASAELHEDASIVFQESFLFASSIRDNITLERPAQPADIEAAARLAQAHDFIMQLPHGYETVVGERGVTLSGGQRQRVALARALLRSPRLLILDDATSSVDPSVERAILDGLRNEFTSTLVVIAYRVSTIRLADRVLFLEDGRIAAEGTHDELLSHPSYDAMVRAYERSAA